LDAFNVFDRLDWFAMHRLSDAAFASSLVGIERLLIESIDVARL
jgi:hypothetical protein